MIAISFLFIFLVNLLPGFCRKHYSRWKLLKQIPMPDFYPYHWLLGHIPAIRKQDEEYILKMVTEVNKPCNKDKTIVKVSLGFITLVNILDSKFVATLLKEPKTRLVYGMLVSWLGEGLLLAEGMKWFRNRRLLTPAFHYKILKDYVPVYNSCLSVLLDKWSESAQKGESVLIFDTLRSMSLDIMQCAFSFKSDCHTAKVQHPYVDACSNLVYLCSDRIMNPLYLVDWLYWLTPHGRKTNKMCKLVHQHAENIIADRKSAFSCNDKEKSHEASMNENGKASRNLDFLDILLMVKDEEGKGMSNLEIRNEVDTFMFEGHDTPTSAISWTLYCLAQYPEHQDKVREEVRSILKGREWLKFDDLSYLNYTMWWMKEAMRFYPPVFSFYRKTTKEVEIGQYVIPKDVHIAIYPIMIHRNGNIWENPMEYEPLHFQPCNLEKHAPYDYIPFSAGSRNCIGQNFALNEMKVVIEMIVSRFLLKVDKSHHVEMLPRVVL